MSKDRCHPPRTKAWPSLFARLSARLPALAAASECWRAELRIHDIRVMQVNPSEVVTEFQARMGRQQVVNETKLRPIEIAHAIKAMLEMDDRGFIPELTVWATNPK